MCRFYLTIDKMKYGNCLIGALVLLYKERYNNPKFIIRSRPQTLIPHFMVCSNTGLHHYKTKKDLLPFPFCYFVFCGEFKTLKIDGE
jgi:hypothetical protein